MDMVKPQPKRFEVWLAELDPTRGSEIAKNRPCIIVSPDLANRALNTVIAIPLTSTFKSYPTRVNTVFQDKKGQAALDQIRVLNKVRLKKKMGTILPSTQHEIISKLLALFAL